jgi:SHS2 domain-containing protein
MGTFEIHARPDGIGISVRAATLPELFETAAEGLCEALINAGSVENRVWLERATSGDTVPGLLTAWLDDVLVLLNVEQFMPKTFVIDDLAGMRLRATVHGEPLDEARHRPKVALASVTATADRVSHGAAGWSAYVTVEVRAGQQRSTEGKKGRQ